MASRTGSGGSAINMLLTRGRHLFCLVLLSSQKLKAIGNVCRINAQALIIFRLRNASELESIISEISAVYDKKTLMEMYQMATAEPYSFWYINLAASNVEDMFWLRFEHRMVPTTAPSQNALVQ